MKQKLLDQIERKELTVGIIGIGYIGLPLLNLFVENGFHTIGFDIDSSRIETLEAGKSYIRHIPNERIKQSFATGRLTVTEDFARIRDCGAVIITVPTPLTENMAPDISYIESSARTVSQHAQKGQVIILESTTYPGTTEEVLVPILEESGLKVDEDIWVGYSPEREDPNNPNFTTANIPKVVSATSPEGLEVVNALYRQIIRVTVPVSTPRVAEAAKLLENIFRSVNIALVNELKIALTKMGIDIWEVIDVAQTKPFGFMPFYPGPGVGGHCIPVDPFYFSWKARGYNIYTRLIELAGEINTSMPDFVVSRVGDALNQWGKPVKGSKILVLGLAYKPNVDDDRNSPSYDLLTRLETKGADVYYHDPFIPEIRFNPEYPHLAGKKSADLNDSYDLFLIATAHDEYRKIDFDAYDIPVVDTRNLIPNPKSHIFKA